MNQIKRTLNKVLPRAVSYGLIYSKYRVAQELNKRRFLGGPYYCPVCDSSLKSFVEFGGTAWCPICESGERHRVDWVFMKAKTDLLSGTPRRMMHVAPEMVFVLAFQKIPNLSYLSVDLENPRAMQRVDITDIGYPDASFDVIYCSHVLEHIVDDRKAMRELYRVCKPGGWGLLQVPITAAQTFEDPSITTPEQRLAVFGQEDHVRRCGLDYADRIRSAGFDVSQLAAREFMSAEQLGQMGILKQDRYIFFCRRLN